MGVCFVVYEETSTNSRQWPPINPPMGPPDRWGLMAYTIGVDHLGDVVVLRAKQLCFVGAEGSVTERAEIVSVETSGRR